MLAEGAFWDIYHEHCSYFTIGSHARLLRRAGLNVSHSRLAYQGQYIIQYASPGTGNPLPEEDDLDRILMLSDAFPGHVAKARDNWIKRVRDTHESGKRVAIWGGGSKAVSFLTTNKLGPEIDHVIDINVHKQGKHMPGTGHIVSAPEVLQRCPPDLVIVMNPVYLSEVCSALAEMDLHPEVVAV